MPSPKPKIEKVLAALGDPTRRAIVERLGERPYSVSNLAEPLGVTLTAIAQHLAVLEECGLAHTEKVGRVRTARLAIAGLDTLDHWTRARRSQWERALDQLGDMLEEE